MHTLESSRLRKFHYCKPAYLALASRLNLVTEQVKNSRCGIACFQELDDQILPILEENLNETHFLATAKLNLSLPSRDGVGIFVDSSRFEVLDTKAVRFGEFVDKHLPSLGEGAHEDKSSVSLTRALYREVSEKMNLAVMVRLMDKDANKELIVCSSHLFWDPAYPDIKLIQSFILAKEIEEFSNKLPVIVGADLNSIPITSGVYELLMGSGTVECSHAHHPVTLRSNKVNSILKSVSSDDVPSISITAPFKSAYKSRNGEEPAFTNYTSGFKGCLDYVLLKKFSVASTSTLPTESELSAETALPNSKVPSDHLPLVVDVEYIL